MKSYVKDLRVATQGKGTYEITDAIEQIVRESEIQTGIVTVFIQHTSASLIIFENADSLARVDLEAWFEENVREDTDYFKHTYEGLDDSTSHIRSVLSRTSEVIPIVKGCLQLGTWQGIFVFEHRKAYQQRRVQVMVLGI